MRKIWVKADPWDKDLVTTALEGGADGVMVPAGFSEQARALGRIQTICDDGDIIPGRDLVVYEIKSGDDEADIVRLSRQKRVILQCRDWTVIPIENLIAKGADIIAEVCSLAEAQTAFGILEKGVKHILLDIRDPLELKEALAALTVRGENILLQPARIEAVRPVGMGDRVCVDTCSSMETGQGLLVGNSSGVLFLVHAESVANPYVAPRPFRVNAGAVHAYTRVPDGRTRYLSELAAGDPVMIVDFNGATRWGTVGRVKIERRPLMLVSALVDDRPATTIVQNAETIRLTAPDGQPVSVVALNPGDAVLVAVEATGRHFGHKIDETITER